MAFAFKPTNAASIAVTIGVEDELAGYIIQNEDIDETTQNLEIADQKGRTCQVIAYDKGKTISLTMIGPNTAPCDVGEQLSISSNAITVVASGGDYIVQRVRRTCTYGDTAKWQIDAVGYAHATYSDKTEDAL